MNLVKLYLISNKVTDKINKMIFKGPRPIHWACRKGHASVVQVLLQSGVAVNAADFKG